MLCSLVGRPTAPFGAGSGQQGLTSRYLFGGAADPPLVDLLVGAVLLDVLQGLVGRLHQRAVLGEGDAVLGPRRDDPAGSGVRRLRCTARGCLRSSSATATT